MVLQNRRAWPRERNPVPVLILDPTDAIEEPYRGWVVDKSRGGVLLCRPRSTPAIGNVLRVQPRSAGGELPWISLKVMNRRVKKDRVELGCEFLQRDRWERVLFL